LSPSQRAGTGRWRNHAERALSRLLHQPERSAARHLYDLVLREIEEPLFRVVLDYRKATRGRAAGILGINRGTCARN